MPPISASWSRVWTLPTAPPSLALHGYAEPHGWIATQATEMGLRGAVVRRQFSVVQTLVREGAPITHATLLDAVEKSTVEILTFLLANGGDPNSVREERFGVFPLLISALMQSTPEQIQVLLDHGARVDIANNRGETALHWTGERPRQGARLVRLLLAYGADSNHQDAKGDTPLFWNLSPFGERFEAAELLLEHGADPTIRNRHGKTVRDVLRTEHHAWLDRVVAAHAPPRGVSAVCPR